MKFKLIFSILLVFSGAISTVFGQNEALNQYDQQGERHGVWKKYYDNNRLRYEGEFRHGEEVGTFKFYDEEGYNRPVATKTYNSENDSVAVKFYNSKRNFLQSEGKMIGQNREGWWNYYKRGYKGNLIGREHYRNGVLDGLKITYFPNGQITVKQEFKNGKQEGIKEVYAQEGQLLQKYVFKNDRLHGESQVFDPLGKLNSEGAYKNGLRDGEWRFYTDGKLDSITNYPLKREVKKKKK